VAVVSLTCAEAARQICREIIDSEPELFHQMTPEEQAVYDARMAANRAEIVARMHANEEAV